VLMLPTEVQRGAAGGEEHQGGTVREEFGNGRRGLENVLEVIQQKKDLLLAEVRTQRRHKRLIRHLAHAQGRGDGGGDERRAGEWRQIDEHHAVGERRASD
jgi:hypothetical protein